MYTYFKRSRLKHALKMLATSTLVLSLVVQQAAAVATWNATLLVNTESFMQIDPGDGTTNVELFFGAAEKLYLDIATNSFVFTKGLTVTGTVTGSSLAAADVLSCPVVTTDASGKLVCGGYSALDARYVNVSGDTMTGALTIANGAGLSASGNILTDGSLTLNADGTADTATLNFGGSLTKTLSYNTNKFVFSDSLQVNGNSTVTGNSTVGGNLNVTGSTVLNGAAVLNSNLSVAGNTGLTGTLSVTGATTLNSTLNVAGNTGITGGLTVTGATVLNNASVKINGVQYTFTGTQGGANTTLVNNGAGVLTWQAAPSQTSSGGKLFLNPQYPNAVYKADGSANVGTLSQDVVSNQNYYVWTTSKAAAQDYDIYVRVKVPETFSSWSASGVQLQYANSGAATTLLSLVDTAGSTQAGTVTGAGTTGIITMTPSGTYTPGGYMTAIIKMSATSAGAGKIGYLNFNWITTAP